MPIINLRKYYYPTIQKYAFVEVSGEVAEALEEWLRIGRRQEKKKLYHKVFSMDTNDWTQLHISVYAQSPEDLLLQAEEHAGKERNLSRMNEAFARLTPTQARRIRARYMGGKKLREIGEAEGTGESEAGHSVRSGIRRMRCSYERQGIKKIPTIHMGVAASQMERRGIATEKGDINRQIADDNKLLKEIKTRITRIYNWTKEQAEADQLQDSGSLAARLYEAQTKVNSNKARSRSGKIKALQENAKLLAFLQGNGINSMQELYDKVAVMNKDYYDLRGKIVKAERRTAVLDERLEMWVQYEKFKPIRQKLDKVKPGKQEKYQQEHRNELAAFHAAADFLKRLKESGEKITPKAWRAEAAKLTIQKDADYQKMRDMREEFEAVENLRKAADRLAREGQHQQKENER